jgi:hypothetical protein
MQNRIEPTAFAETVRQIGVLLKSQSHYGCASGWSDNAATRCIAQLTTNNVRDDLLRIPAWAPVLLFGSDDYAIRVDRSVQISSAWTHYSGSYCVSVNRTRSAAGTVGAPHFKGTEFQLAVYPGRLTTGGLPTSSCSGEGHGGT